MDVCLEHVRDSHVPRGSELEIHLDIAPGIHDGDDARILAANRVRVLRQPLVFESFEQHLTLPERPRGPSYTGHTTTETRQRRRR